VARLFKTRGIVLHQIKYGETSLIVKIYTELFGLQTYLFKGVRSRNSKIKPNLLQHGSLVEMIVYHKEKEGLEHVKEIRCALQYQTIPFDIRKSSIVLFISEILYKTVYEEESNPGLFNFIYESFKFLDDTDKTVSGFHLLFTIQLTGFLGFFPQGRLQEPGEIFNLEEGIFTNIQPLHKHFIDSDLTVVFDNFLVSGYKDLPYIHLSPDARMILLNKILDYYSLHMPSFKEIRSHIVLREVLG
jgi:DNA repair protein RecO (recombination protein O)